MEKHWFDCQCSSMEHSFRVTYNENDCEIYIEMRLGTWLPWWRRILNAFRYVFSPGSSRYGHYDEVMLRGEDVGKLINILEKIKPKPIN